MISIANQKRFIGLTVSFLATIVPLGMLANRIALGTVPITVPTDAQLKTFRDKVLAETNNDRANRGATKPLVLGDPSSTTLTPTLADGAQTWAQHLAETGTGNLEHSKAGSAYRADNVGENLFTTGTTSSDPIKPDELAKMAIASWYGEQGNYNYATGKSNGGGEIGHFTQLVWLATTNLNCGYASSKEAPDANGNVFTDYYVDCQYYTAGNVEDQYTTNVIAPDTNK